MALFILFLSILIIPIKSVGEYPPYFRKKSLLNETEQLLFNRLVEAMPNHYIIAKIRLSDIIGVQKGDEWQAWFNKINRKGVDFAICDTSFAVLACIVVDRRTHQQKTDVSEALKAAGIPMLQIEADKIPSTEEINTLLKETP